MSVDFLEAKQSLSVFSRVLRYRMSNSPESLTTTAGRRAVPIRYRRVALYHAISVDPETQELLPSA